MKLERPASWARQPALHQRIRTDIQAKIVSGALRPGERIPFEHELMAEYGCARATVNKALTALAEAGLLTRRKRAGTFVSAPQVHASVLDIPDIQAEILERGGAYGLNLIERTILQSAGGRPEAAPLGGAGGVLRLVCLHIADDRPFAFEERLINLTLAPEAVDADFASSPPGSWLLHHVPWTEGEHKISAVAPGRDIARRLKIDPSDPCLSLERRTWRGAEHVTWARQIFPGAAFHLLARFGSLAP